MTYCQFITQMSFNSLQHFKHLADINKNVNSEYSKALKHTNDIKLSGMQIINHFAEFELPQMTFRRISLSRLPRHKMHFTII